MTRLKSQFNLILVSLIIILFSGNLTVFADSPIGGRPEGESVQSDDSQSLSRVVNEFGNISLSLDAMGTLDTTGTIQVEKPYGATVRKAYLMSATTGGQNIQLDTGDVKLQGTVVVWEQEIPSSIRSYNYWADVTAMVKPVINAAPAGLVDLEITEVYPYEIDGEILAVIFDDPNQTTDNTVLLYFGAQNVAGDTFEINFAEPIDTDGPDL